MAVLVDTNVIFDVLNADQEWGQWSRDKLAEYRGQLTINPLIFAEICYGADSQQEAEEIVEGFGLHFENLSQDALYLCAKAYSAYRRRGGEKTAPLADFFIGVHAEALSIPILTRDVSRYKTYFPKVTLISP
ncbi:MAG: PIN domain-containing protein [Candidatus Latescibacteria bacterium]|nr:PIN domain-containing protein [Candidatus Latescibacterota bacterium]